MRWLHNISFSSSSSTSSSLSPHKRSSSSFSSSSMAREETLPSIRRGHGSRISRNNHRSLTLGGGGDERPKLIRQRKLRHLTDQDLAGEKKQVAPPDHHVDSGALPRSTSASVAVPLPLPLPVPSGDGDLRLPSPKERHRDGFRERERERGDRIGEGLSSSNSPISSTFAGRNMKKMIKHLRSQSPRMVRPDFSTAQSSRDNFGINIPTRSAPTSPFASPVRSPPRTSNTADMLPYYRMIAKANQVWSAPEMATLDIPGLPPPAFMDISAFSTDNSPLQSPPNLSPQRSARSPTGPPSPLIAKLSIESSAAWRESNANFEVHPLPLPPGAAVPSPSVPVPLALSKLESMSMKSQWQKGKLIGRGTFGSVYVASNRETGALCAMKEVEMYPDDPKSAESIKQLEQVDDKFYIYLEYVHPGSINKYVREHCGAITESVVRNFSRHIVSGLAYLHSMKTIHRDIKGANLLVDASGVVKLADFGMAKLLTGQAADLSLKGSPYWMAPELMQAVMHKDSSSDLALAVDIWSLGCTIIEMFTGKPPWSEYEGAAAMFKVMRDSPSIPEVLSPAGKDFLRCCFRRNPAERPSATMLLEHRWFKNSQQLDVSSTIQSISGIKLTDISQSLRASEVKFDHLPGLPSSRSTKGKTTADSFAHYSFSPAKLSNDFVMKLPT
ncbi:mitogen-activated protein kinase kinase kinase 5-like isoform X2 [Populus nigra]|uniref:mitogen-activated protein kinase kinase kinase 5-like isoform X2 n=1 Tax=Populus nigra TaxID=3691 RepID=UPI002B271462|nr:mitogen-activated protein kinase kinase kinase 5-like isoform X2 [Populus nigra]